MKRLLTNSEYHVNRSIAKLILLIFFVSNSVFAFDAVLSCEHGNRHINIAACFAGSVDTEIKLTNFGRTNIYKMWQLNELGVEYQDGLHFELSDSFSLQAQNSSDVLNLRLIIKDDSGKVLFEDVVSQFGVIGVQN